jgi:hypothetical protein
MKSSKSARFSIRSLIAAAALGVCAQSAQASTLNYTADDTGPIGGPTSRLRVEIYNAFTGWYYGNPVNSPTVTSTINGVVQNGSINFLNTKNGQFYQSYTGYADSITATVYQAGIDVGGLLIGTAIGAAIIPNVSIATVNLGYSSSNYNYYNPDTYAAYLNLTNATVNGTSGRDAIHTDLNVTSTLNLYGTNYINGATLVDTINGYDNSNTTFNGSVYGATTLGFDTVATYTSQASRVEGGIYGNGGQFNGEGAATVNFDGGNVVNGDVILQPNYNGPFGGSPSTINIRGNGVVFNGGSGQNDGDGYLLNIGAEYINFTTAGSLTLGNNLNVVVGDINFNGNNATLNVGDNVNIYAAYNGVITSAGQSGTINFSGNSKIETYGSAFNGEGIGGPGALAAINVNGGSNSTVRLYTPTYTKAVAVNLNAGGTLVLQNGLNSLYQDGLTLGTLKYFNNNAEVQIGSEGYDITSSIELRTNISTDTNNNGKLKFLGGVVNVFGSVASLDKELSRIDVGGTGSGVGDDVSSSKPYTYSSVFFNTDVYAHDVSLNGNEAYITVASGYDIKGTTLSSFAINNSGLTLAGGNQTADFVNIGGNNSSGASDMLGFINSGNAIGDVSTFTGNVFADNIYTTDGVTNYQKNVTAGDAYIENGTTNFNANGTTPSASATNISNRLTFGGTGVANFYQGVTLQSGTTPGAINFNGYGGTVNISAGENLIGNVINIDTISQTADGTLNFLGGTQLLSGYVGTGSGNQSIELLHVGSNSQANLTVTGNINSIETRLSYNSTLNARGNITGNVTNSSTIPAGILNLTELYNQSVNGNVGSSSAALALVQAGSSSGASTYFNGMVYATKLKFDGPGTIELNGTNGGSAVGGVVGQVDFNNHNADLNIGDNVNLTFSTSAATFANANNASMTFLGSSTVTGTVGGAWTGTTPATSTLRDIYAGANGETVNFLGKVYVSATTFHVSGTGTVNFSDDLVGPLVFEAGGTANFNHTKGIVGITPGNGTVTTTLDGQGVLNFLGSTTQDGEIGVFDAFTPVFGRLNTVNFHSGTTAASVTQNLNYSVYSWYTNIGNTGTVGATPTTTAAIIGRNPNSGDNIHLGSVVAMADDSTTLFTAGVQYLTPNGAPIDDSYVDFAHTKNADGTLALGTSPASVAITQSRFDESLTTNNGTLGFAISAEPYTNSTAPGTYNGVVASNSALSSSINGESYGTENNYAGSSLNMGGNETVQVAFLGSMKDNVSYTLVDVENNDGGMGTGPMPYNLLDNSFTIDTTLSRSNSDADLVITTHRDEFTYLDKSGTKLLGLRSYDLAHRLGQLGAAGTGYSAAVQVVLNKLDLDQWGYGNNEANLARQLYLLTPAGDGAAVKAGTGLTSQAVGVVLDNSDALSTRATPQKNYWVRAFGSHDNQTGKGEYAGYNTNGGGLAVGVDHAVGESILGLAIGYGKATATSSGLRDGDKANVDSTIAGVYFRRPVGEYFLNAMIDGAKHRTKTERQTAVGDRAHGDYTGTEIGGRIQLGRKFGLSDKKASLTPVVAVNYSRYTQEAYSETGADGVGLSYTQQKYSQSDASISLRYAVETDLGEGMASSFSASLGYKHLLSSPTYNNTVSFIGDINSFDVAGTKDSRKGSVIASIAYNYNPSKGVTYTIDYNGEAKSGYNAHSLGFRATWEY